MRLADAPLGQGTIWVRGAGLVRSIVEEEILPTC
jgi:hypothetical protein